MITLNDIIKSIREQFENGPPNGWILGWDLSRYFALVSTAAAPYPTSNYTAFDYGFCNWFEVRVNSDSNQQYWTLTIKLSFIVPTYCVHWTYYESSTQGAVIPVAPVRYRSVEEKVRIAVEDAGFFELPVEWYEEHIHGIELELSGKDNVTVGKCLFSDYEE
jgi:hypothetical protein